MFILLVILLVVGLGLVVVITVGAIFIQGYFYTEPTEGLLWRGPVAAAVLTFFFALWCWLNAFSREASPLDIPFDTLFRFSPRVELVKQPVAKLWSIKKGNPEPVEYRMHKIPVAGQVRYEYREAAVGGRPWNSANVEAVLIQVNGEKLRFEPRKAAEGGYREFVNDQGWVMLEYDTGISGLPTMSRLDRLGVNLLLNLSHLGLWFVLLWLLLHFQWSHALGLALILWAIVTLLVLPMLLTQAVQGAVQSASMINAAGLQILFF